MQDNPLTPLERKLARIPDDLPRDEAILKASLITLNFARGLAAGCRDEDNPPTGEQVISHVHNVTVAMEGKLEAAVSTADQPEAPLTG